MTNRSKAGYSDVDECDSNRFWKEDEISNRVGGVKWGVVSCHQLHASAAEASRSDLDPWL